MAQTEDVGNGVGPGVYFMDNMGDLVLENPIRGGNVSFTRSRNFGHPRLNRPFSNRSVSGVPEDSAENMANIIRGIQELSEVVEEDSAGDSESENSDSGEPTNPIVEVIEDPDAPAQVEAQGVILIPPPPFVSFTEEFEEAYEAVDDWWEDQFDKLYNSYYAMSSVIAQYSFWKSFLISWFIVYRTIKYFKSITYVPLAMIGSTILSYAMDNFGPFALQNIVPIMFWLCKSSSRWFCIIGYFLWKTGWKLWYLLGLMRLWLTIYNIRIVFSRFKQSYDRFKERLSLWWSRIEPIKWQILLGSVIGVVIGYFVYKAIRKLAKRKQQPINQGFFDKKQKAMLQLGAFIVSLGLTGKLHLWKMIQPYVSCCDWVYTIFSDEEVGCKNHGKISICRSSSYDSSSLCMRCTRAEVENEMHDKRTSNYLICHRYEAFQMLVEDKANNRNIDWWMDFADLHKRHVLGQTKTAFNQPLYEGTFPVATVPGYYLYQIDRLPIDRDNVSDVARLWKHKFGNLSGNLITPEEYEKLDLKVYGVQSNLIFKVKPPSETDGVFLTLGNTHLIVHGVISVDEEMLSFKEELKQKYDKYLKPYLGAYVLMGIFIVIIIFAHFLNERRYTIMKNWFYNKIFWIFGWNSQDSRDTAVLVVKDQANIVNSDKIVRQLYVPELDKNPEATYVAAMDEGGGKKHNMSRKPGYHNSRNRTNLDVDDVKASRTSRNITYHQDIKEGLYERDAPGANRRQIYDNDVLDEEQWKKRHRERDDFKINLKPDKKSFIFYNADTLKKQVTPEGIEMFPYALPPSQRFSNSVWARTADEYDTYYQAGYRPKVIEGVKLDIPWNTWKQNRRGFIQLYKFLQFYKEMAEDNPQFDPYRDIKHSFDVAGLSAVDSIRDVIRKSPEWIRQAVSVLDDNGEREVQLSNSEVEDFNYRFSVSGHLNPFTGDESNRQEDTSNLCPYWLFFKECRVSGCIREHDSTGYEPTRNQSIDFPIKLDVDSRCAYDVVIESEGTHEKIGVCTRVSSGGFITAGHLIYDESNLIRAQLIKFKIRDHETGDYYQLSAVHNRYNDDESTLEKMGQGWIWDYAKLYVSNNDFLERSSKFAVTPTIIHKNLLDSIRMIKTSDKGHQQDTGSVALLISNRINYAGINTIRGDSGSPVFDANGRFIAIHKAGSPNHGLTFTFNEKFVPSWFYSMVPKKSLTPCIHQ